MPRVTPARAVLATHTVLYETLKNPPGELVRTYDYLITNGGKAAGLHRQGGSPGLAENEAEILAAWHYYTWPASNGRELIGLMAGPLYAAPTYQVTTEIVRAVTAMYQATANAGFTVRAADLPSPTGYVYLDEPITLTDYLGDHDSARAMSWGPQWFAPPETAPMEGVRVSSWWWPGTRPDELTAPGPGYPGAYSAFIPFGAVGTSRADDITRWLHCLWLFMGTEIAATARVPAEEHARKRATRSGRQVSDVTVVVLRRAHCADDPGRHSRVDWSCCWVVQGHWRHIESYGGEHHHAVASGQRCTACGARLTWVRPYVKGPEGLPLKSAEQVLRVTR